MPDVGREVAVIFIGDRRIKVNLGMDTQVDDGGNEVRKNGYVEIYNSETCVSSRI